MTVALRIVLACTLAASALAPAWALGEAEVTGRVTDADGKPIQGAKVTLKNATMDQGVYQETTDKRGVFRLPPIPYNAQARVWLATVTAEGYVPSRVKITVRTADRTLAGEPVDAALTALSPPQQVHLVGFGKAEVNYTMVPGDASAAAAEAAGAAPTGAGAPAAAPAEEDPYAQGIEKARAKDWAAALPLFEKAVEAQPEDAERREMLARALFHLDRRAEAVREASRAAALAPDGLDSKLLLVDMQRSVEDLEGAWTTIEAAFALAPGDARVLDRRAHLAAALGKQQEAIAAYKQLLEVEPARAEAWLDLGLLYADAGDPTQSEAAFRKVTELDPANAYRTFFNIGVVIEKRPDLSPEDTRKAVEAYRKAIEIKEEYAPAHRNLAYALLRSNDFAGARRELERYLELDPKAADAASVRALLKDLPK